MTTGKASHTSMAHKIKGEVGSVLLLTKHHAVKEHCGSGGIDPRIFYLGTRWR